MVKARKSPVSVTLDWDTIELVEKLRKGGFNLSQEMRTHLSTNKETLIEKYKIIN